MSDIHPAWHQVEAGTKTTFSFPVAGRADGSIIKLPVMVVRGAKPGKTLLVIAGVHGDEFEGMAALHQVFAGCEPERLTGTFVAVPIANPPSFEAGLRTNPDDRQDMARVFPGDPAGTVTEQIAHALTQHFIRHADLLCDLHSAGQYYAMPPLCGYQLRDEPMLSMQRAAARAFGLPLVWGTPGLPGRSLSAAGEHRVPAIYAELTGEGRCRPADVARYVHGVRQLMIFLGLTGETLRVTHAVQVVEDNQAGAGFLQMQNRAPLGGLFDPEVAIGADVIKDQRIGVIRDAFGAIKHEVRATHTGRIVFLRTFPRVLAGDALCTVLEIQG